METVSLPIFLANRCSHFKPTVEIYFNLPVDYFIVVFHTIGEKIHNHGFLALDFELNLG